MPFEKVRYIRQRMADKQRTDIELTPLKAEIEAVFSEHNIDEDCDSIAKLLTPYRKMIRESLSQGNYSDAVTVLLEVLESLTSILWKMNITITSMTCTALIMPAKT